MSETTIAKAEKTIASKTDYVGGGMGGYAALALIDENGYPTASTLTIAKADGIKWITFATSLDSDKAKRIEKCNRASVCINSSEYNISLVGTIEVLTDDESKRANWLPPMSEMWSGHDDPGFCVLRFKTERYNFFFADDCSEAKGTI